MIIDRNKISIVECSYEEYRQIKTYQRIKPPSNQENNTIYGLIKENSTSIGSFARNIYESIDQIKIIKKLKPKLEEKNHIFLKRDQIYNLEKGINELPENTATLARWVREGRGIDLILKTDNNEPEIHYYRVREEDIFLVEAQIPRLVLENGLYLFKRSSKEKYETLKATSHMPKQEIKRQLHQRRNLN